MADKQPMMPTTRTGPIMVTSAKAMWSPKKGGHPAGRLPGEECTAPLIRSNSEHQRGEKRFKGQKGGFHGGI